MLLDMKHLSKVYEGKGQDTVALRDVDVSVDSGEFVAIMGESGSGKSTLLNIIATYDKPSGGQVILNGQDLGQVKDSELAAFRRVNLGFVFQEFNLLDIFSNRDNILLPMVLSDARVPEMESRLAELGPFLGIEDILDKFPYEVSGGQRQRVAIARALINQPQILLADEPTGALDSKTSEQILDLFERINGQGKTILMVTHSIRAASRAKRVLFIKDGIVYHEIYRGDQPARAFQERIADSLAMLNERED